MFSLFKTPRHIDSELGELTYSRGAWRGALNVAGSRVPLALAGKRSTRSVEALALVRRVQAHLTSNRAAIEAELFAQYTAYREAVESGEFAPEEPLPTVQAAQRVWPHVALQFVAVMPLSGQLTTEIGYSTAWDEEHMLGVRLQDGALVELCGSTVVP